MRGERGGPNLTTLGDDPTPSRHGPIAQLLFTWSPLSLILVAYAAADWVSGPLRDSVGAGSNRFGFGLQMPGPAQADLAVFGTVPTVWLQEQFVDGTVHWYDAAAALVYATHFISFPLITGVVWFCLRDRFAAWITAVLTFTAVGVVGYTVYPAAPPWMASDSGEIGAVTRIATPGWDYLQLDPIGQLIAWGQAGSNPVAAMPSLHAGSALLIVLFLWPVVTRRWRAALLGYAMLMALTLVYTGEHYVADVVAGWLTAAVALGAGSAVRTHQARARQPRDSEKPELEVASSATMELAERGCDEVAGAVAKTRVADPARAPSHETGVG